MAPVAQTTANYRRDYGSAGWAFARVRTTFNATVNWEHDDYQAQSIFNATRASLGLNVGRAITPNLSANVIGTLDRYEYLNEGFTDKFGTIGGALAYRPGRWFIVYARYDHTFRRASGNLTGFAGPSYDENRVFVMVGYRPHSDTESGQGPGFGGAAAP